MGLLGNGVEKEKLISVPKPNTPIKMLVQSQ